jgi:DEAD/DEAH box helicase domain-containing protein
VPPVTRADVVEVVERVRGGERLGPQVRHALYLPAVAARWGALDPPLPRRLLSALGARGIERLWSHQVSGLRAVRQGHDVLVTTPTASGKSLIFQLPVLEAAAGGATGRALFLYPLKALGQDQKQKFEALAGAAGIEAACEVYDGDTPAERRAEIRRKLPRVLISNPDMLHLGLLSHWQNWSPFLRDLEWIVLDELHTYRGIFGSHFHHVLQRLLRVCHAEGARPRLIASSATARNAEEFAAALTGRGLVGVADSGAPRQGRHFLLFQPETSPYTTALQLTIELLRSGLKTIVFTKSRRITELLYSWLQRQEPALARRVANYRSGFLARERRTIERKLFDGELDGVISTSALELGIDIGGLDACVLVGFPGSVMATWQRAGRVGRQDRESIVALVPLPDALDQYLLDHPREFLERPCERLVVDPANEPVARAHLVCAAAELPLRRGRDAAYLERFAPTVGELLREGLLAEAVDSGEICSPRKRPQRDVALRGSGGGTAILDERGRTIGTVDGVRVLHECHPGAVYLHWGRQFLVRSLDLAGGKTHVERVEVDYFTTPLTRKATQVLEVLEERREGPLQAFLGRLRVTEWVVGFERKSIHGQEVLDRHDLELPPVEFETVGLWFAVPSEIEELLRGEERHFMGALHAAEHAAIAFLPLHALCDRGDIGGISLPLHPQLGCGGVFIYDGHPGGVGIAARGFADLPALLERVRRHVAACECEIGCPSCIQSPKCGNGNRPLDKAGAVRLLDLLLDPEALGVGSVRRVEVAPPEPEVPQAAASHPEGIREVVEGPLDAPPAPLEPPRTAASVEIYRPTEEMGRPARPRGGRRRPEPPPGPPIPVHSSDTVLFDLETIRGAREVGGWGNAHRMRVAIAVTLHLEEGRFQVFREDEIDRLIERLEAADAVVGFNVRRFDYQVLNGYTGIDYCRRLPTLDLLEEIHRRSGVRLSLNRLAAATLGVQKTADGLQSLEWVKEGRLDLVEAYCLKDVEILRDLYLYGRRMGHVYYGDKEGRRFKVTVGW